jgi:hypothetical protein
MESMAIGIGMEVLTSTANSGGAALSRTHFCRQTWRRRRLL